MATPVPGGLRAEAGVTSTGKAGTRQAAPGDLPSVGGTRDPGLAISPEQFGAAQARAMQGFGNALGHVADVAHELQRRRQTADDSVFLARAKSELNRRMFEATTQAQNEIESVDGYMDLVTGKYDQVQQDVLNDLRSRYNPSDEALQKYEVLSIGTAENYSMKGLVFAHNERVAEYTREIGIEVDEIARGAFLNGDIETAMSAVGDTVDAAAPIMSPSELASLRDSSRERVSTAYVEGRIKADPSSVLDYELEGGGSLFASLIAQESGGNPEAVSPKGAAGITQVMPDTAREIAVELGDETFPHGGSKKEIQEFLKVESNGLRYGRHYLNKMLRRYGGDVEAALIAYNGGPGRADNWLAAGRDDSVLPEETSKYYKSVLARTDKGGGTLGRAFKNIPFDKQMKLMDKARREGERRLRMLGERFDDHIANIEMFGEGLEGFSLDEMSRFADEETMADIRAREEQAFVDHDTFETIRMAPPSQAIAAVREAAPVPGSEDIVAQQARHERFIKAFQQRQKALTEDPAGYVSGVFPEIDYETAFESGDATELQDVVETSMDAQIRLGVSEPQAIPRSTAQSIVQNIEQQPIDQMAAVLSVELEKYGEHSGVVLRDLRAAGLSDEAYISGLYADDPLVSRQLASVLGVSEDEIASGVPSIDVKDTKENVESEFSEYRQIFLFGDPTSKSALEFDALMKTAKKLALKNVSRGMSPAEAARQAHESLVDKHMSLVSGGQVVAPVPKEFDAGLVESGGEDALKRASVEEMDLELFGDVGRALGFVDRERTISAIVNAGTWVYAGDGQSMNLVILLEDGSTILVRDSKGRPVSMTFSEAEARGSSSPSNVMMEASP